MEKEKKVSKLTKASLILLIFTFIFIVAYWAIVRTWEATAYRVPHFYDFLFNFNLNTDEPIKMMSQVIGMAICYCLIFIGLFAFVLSLISISYNKQRKASLAFLGLSICPLAIFGPLSGLVGFMAFGLVDCISTSSTYGVLLTFINLIACILILIFTIVTLRAIYLAGKIQPETPVQIVEEKKEEPAPVVEEAKLETPAPIKNEFVRISFAERLLKSDNNVKANYNEIKNELISYGLKSRVAFAGDTYRLHKIEYAKITVAGKGLKLYLALDPKKYADTTMPVSDASNKGLYENVPLMIKIKSDLSIRRAKQLIQDMLKDNPEFKKTDMKPVNWVKELKK